MTLLFIYLNTLAFFIFIIVIIYLFYTNKILRQEFIQLNENFQKVKNIVNQLQDKNKPIENSILSNTSSIINLKKSINDTAQKINSINIQSNEINKRIDNLSEFFSIGKSIDSKENNKYDSINTNLLDDYRNISYKNFLEKYDDYKSIGIVNYEDIRINNSVPPNFSEIATAHCIAVHLENDLYSIIIKKGLELRYETIDSTGISYMFELSEEPIKDFFYGEWEIIKLPVFQKLNNNKWICLIKGYLKLRSNTTNQNSININENNNLELDDFDLNIDNKLEIYLRDGLEDFKNFSQSVFLSKNPDAKSLKLRRYKEKIFFNIDNQGNFISFQTNSLKTSNFNEYYILCVKNDTLKNIFNSKNHNLFNKLKLFTSKNEEKEFEIKSIEDVFNILYEKNYSSTQIIKPALIRLRKTNKETSLSYELIKKGEIVII